MHPARHISSPSGRVSITTIVLVVLLLVCGGVAVYFGCWWADNRNRLQPPTPIQVSAKLPGQSQSQPSPTTVPVEKWLDYAGLPRPVGYPNAITVLTNIGYLSGYDSVRKNPAWVCYHLFQVTTGTAHPRPAHFFSDPRTGDTVLPEMYSGSGYDRGHMAPNHAIAVCYGAAAQNETFLMSNIVPQTPALNRHVWERMEELEYKQYLLRFHHVWIVTGPVYGAETRRLRNGPVVPTACYKIMLNEAGGSPQAQAFIVPQTVSGTEPVAQFVVSVAQVQQTTGLEFFWQLDEPVKTSLRQRMPKNVW
ncbi:MAG: DNA/RNA non-specific endonuclease [Verrucomicrobiota bacterium]